MKTLPNMLIAQSGGPSMVINQSLVGAVLAARKTKRFGKIYGALHGIQGILDEKVIDLKRESRATLEKVAATPSAALGSVRRKPTGDDCLAIFDTLRRLNVEAFFYIGGNDSAETLNIVRRTARKSGFPLPCVHIPKTIDNDLRENDHTPGYGSAARFVALAHMGDSLDNEALGGVKINIVMGRHAGFLAAAAALARQRPDDGPHLIYLPERVFDMSRFTTDIQRVTRRLGRCVATVSEGITGPSGNPIAADFIHEADAHGNIQLSGSGALGDILAAEVRRATGIQRVRADTFGYLQRSFFGAVSPVDAREARQVGEQAVAAALSGCDSVSIAISRVSSQPYSVVYRTVPLSKVARHTRRMPAKFIRRSGNNVTSAFLEYARPLVGPLPEIGRFSQ